MQGSWIRHREGKQLNLLSVNDLVYTQVGQAGPQLCPNSITC